MVPEYCIDKEILSVTKVLFLFQTGSCFILSYKPELSRDYLK